MNTSQQKGEQYKAKHKFGSLDEEYLSKDELAEARKSIMKYKLRDPGPSIYKKKPKNKKKKK
jgi:hypothetical protein